MKLRAALTQYPLNTLRQLAQDAGLDNETDGNKTILADVLCRVLPEPDRIINRLKLLSKDQQAMVLTLVAEGGELLEEEAIEEFANGFQPRLHNQLETLTGLVFRDDRTFGDGCILVGIPESLLKSIPISETDQGRLRSIMKPVSTGLLRSFAEDLDITLSDSRRPLLAHAIRQALLNPKSLRAFLDKLSEDKRAILDLFISDGPITRQKVSEQLGESAARELEDMLWKAPIFYSPNDDLKTPNASISLASDLCTALSQIAKSRGGQLESHIDDLIETPAIPPSTTQDNTAYLIQDLATLLGIVERRIPRRLKRGGLPKSDLREANTFCHIKDDPGYIEFLTLFIEAAGLVEPQATAWKTASDAGSRMGQIIDMRKACYAFWLQTDRWNEWSADRTNATTASTRIRELINIRREIARSLQQCPADTWITYTSYYQFLMRLSEPFRHFAENPASGRNLAAGGTTADELLRRMLSGALTWMGVVRAGDPSAFREPLHRSKQNAAFQITNAGHALIQNENDESLTDQIPPQNPDAKFVIQPNFEILAPPDLPYSHYLQLCGLGDIKTQDVMTCLHVSRDSICHALSHGKSAAYIRGFLSNNSATGLPDMVASLIAECENKYGEIEIIPAIGFLKVASPDKLEELYAQPRIAQALNERISDTIAPLNDTTKPEALVQILNNQGYMPHLAQNTTTESSNHHQIVFTTAELSDLVAYLETSAETLFAQTTSPSEDLTLLISRLKRALRRTPDELREQAAERYQKAFAKRKPDHQEGLEDLLRYTGTNPATTPAEIQPLLGYAITHQLRVEITYGAIDEGTNRMIEPFSEDHTMLYAFCQTRRGDRVFRLEGISFARLTGERFDRS